MGSHDRENAPPLEDLSPGFREKGVRWTHDDCPVLETERTPQRISPARRFIFSFLVCSLVLFGLSSVHSPRLWQRISCPNGRISNQKVDFEMETESAAASVPDQASPEPLSELHKYFPGLDAAHIDRAQATSMVRMVKRDTNSSSVSARSSEPSSTPETKPSSSAPVTSSNPTTSEPSPTPTPSPSQSSNLSTSTNPPPTTSTKPPPVTSSNPTPSSSDAPRSSSDETTIYTPRSESTTAPPPPPPPKVIIETSTRTSNGQVVIVESTITVQASATGPKPVTESTRPPPSLQNAATRQETRGMALSVLAVGALMGALLV